MSPNVAGSGRAAGDRCYGCATAQSPPIGVQTLAELALITSLKRTLKQYPEFVLGDEWWG